MPTGGGTYAYYQFTATSTTNHTFSFYAKNNGGDANVTMGFFIASQTQSITLTNEWKRFEFTTSITSGNPVQVGVDNLTSVDMLIWGCQVEESLTQQVTFQHQEVQLQETKTSSQEMV